MDRTLLEIFAAEQAEHVQRMRLLLEQSGAATPDTIGAIFNELLRRAHTLKGAARAVGVDATERLIHRLETLFAQWRKSGQAPDDRNLTAVHRGLDTVEDILAWALGGRSEPDTAGVMQALDELEEEGAPSAPVANLPAVEEPARPVPEPEPAPGVGPTVELVRVSARALDDVVRAASQLLHTTYTSSDALFGSGSQTQVLEQTLKEYSRLRRKCISYLRNHAGAPEFRPVSDCFEFLDRQLHVLIADMSSSAAAQRQMYRELRVRAEEVHENACRARMTPAETVFSAFGPMVRDLASAEGKQIQFRAEGLDVQADRMVLQALKDPVMHLLRNAVSHGIELPAERTAAGKPEQGTVRLAIETRGDRLRVAVEDDGKGLDRKGLARQGVRHGIITQAEAETASPETIAGLSFQPGLSTSEAVSSISGRGMGLPAVADIAASLQGEATAGDRRGGGTSVVVSVPLAISTQHVLLLEQSGHAFAVPAAFVDRLVRFHLTDVHIVEGLDHLMVDGAPVRLARLAELLGLPPSTGSKVETQAGAGSPMYQAVILVTGEDRVAVVTDRLLEEREALVQSSGLPQSLGGYSAGAIPLENGSVAVMLSVGRLLQKSIQGDGFSGFAIERAPKKKTRILVVDDSTTTRLVERNILETQGYDVSLAVDGLEALGAIRSNPPDLVISDVNMPRMDGFQLLEQIKADQTIAHIPVILVTSLEQREEQMRGLSLGADAYIVKRKFDQRELLDIVRQLV